MEFPSEQSQTNNECSEAPPLEISEKLETYSSPTSDQNASRPTMHAEQASAPQALHSMSISPNQIGSAIDSLVNARLVCSTVVGLLVVLSDIGFPQLGSKIIWSVLMLRPLYLVLLTNVTDVLAPLVLGKQPTVVSIVQGENKIPLAGRSDWIDQVGNNLELGFLMMKVMDAIIMDCRVCSVIVVYMVCHLHGILLIPDNQIGMQGPLLWLAGLRVNIPSAAKLSFFLYLSAL